jgi:hypothetical protein
MKAIIQGKRYDTETAESIHGWDNRHFPNDFAYVSEVLYRTKNGSYFLHGEGGAASIYSEPCGNNSRCGGDKIIPFTQSEAIEWLEGHGGTEALEKYFPDHIQDA